MATENLLWVPWNCRRMIMPMSRESQRWVSVFWLALACFGSSFYLSSVWYMKSSSCLRLCPHSPFSLKQAINPHMHRKFAAARSFTLSTSVRCHFKNQRAHLASDWIIMCTLDIWFIKAFRSLLIYFHVHVEPAGAQDAFRNFHVTLNATVPFLYLVSWVRTLFEYLISFSSFLLFIVPSQFLWWIMHLKNIRFTWKKAEYFIPIVALTFLLWYMLTS